MCGLLLTLTVQTARAQSAAADFDTDRDAMITARLRHVEGVLSHDEHETRRWWRTWICVQSALLVGNVGWGLITFDDIGARTEHFLNAGGSLLGGLSLVVLRPPALRAPAELAEISDRTPEQRAMKLAAAEGLLAESAEAQAFGTGWAPYTGAFVVGTAIALPLWLKYDRKLGAAATLFGSMALTTLQVATLPTASLKERAVPVPASAVPLMTDGAKRESVSSMGRPAQAASSASVPNDRTGLVRHDDTVEMAQGPSKRAVATRPRARGLTLSLAPTAGGLLLAGRW